MIKTENKTGKILSFSSLGEMTREVCGFHKKQKLHNFLHNEKFTGRYFSSWQDLEEKTTQAWDKGVNIVKGMIEEIRKEDIPNPTSIKRKQTWNENEGDVDVDRYLNQENNFYRQAMRKTHRGPQIVSLVCRLGDNARVKWDKIFWRGAAVVAAVDVLEDAGYACEVISYNRASHAILNSQKEVFVSCELKKAGTDVDIDTLTNGLSTWVYRNIILGSYHMIAPGNVSSGYGGALAGTEPYADVLSTNEGGISIEMPDVYSIDSAVSTIKGLIEKVTHAKERV